jgi:hypothetical protein
MGASKAPVSQATQHPHNVQPWGNYLFAQGKDTRNAGERATQASQGKTISFSMLASKSANLFALIRLQWSCKTLSCFCIALGTKYFVLRVCSGLGRLRTLDDELLMQVLALLPAETLGRLACVNRALYCFSNHEDLWRALTLEASLSNLPGLSHTDMHCRLLRPFGFWCMFWSSAQAKVAILLLVLAC